MATLVRVKSEEESDEEESEKNELPPVPQIDFSDLEKIVEDPKTVEESSEDTSKKRKTDERTNQIEEDTNPETSIQIEDDTNPETLNNIDYIYPKNEKLPLKISMHDGFEVVEREEEVHEFVPETLFQVVNVSVPEFTESEEQLDVNIESLPLCESGAVKSTKKKRPVQKYLNAFLINENQELEKLGEDVDVTHEFYWLMSNFMEACVIFITTWKEYRSRMTEIECMENDLFSFKEMKVKSPPTYCGCGERVQKEVVTKVCSFSKDNHMEMESRVLSATEMYYPLLKAKKFEKLLFEQKISLYIDRIYEHPIFSNCERETANVEHFERNSSVHNVVDKLKKCIKITFHFLEMNENDYFTDCCRKYVRQMVSWLLRIAAVDDHRFIIFSLLRCRGIAKFGSDLFQLPACNPVRSDDALDFFITILSVFLNSQKEAIILTEEDYLSLFDQFPFYSVVQYLFVVSKSKKNYSRFSDWKVSFDFAESMLYLLVNSVQLFSEFKSFSRQIVHTIVTVSGIVDSILLETEYISNEKIHRMWSKFFTKVFCSIVELSCEGFRLWVFLTQLPFSSISKDQKSIIILLMNLFDVHDIELNSVGEWLECLGENDRHRKYFRKLLLDHIDQSSFLIDTITKLVCSCSEYSSSSISIATIVVFEWLMLLKTTCKDQSEEFVSLNLGISASIGTIAKAFTEVCSMVIRIVARYFKEFEQISKVIFRDLVSSSSVKRWIIQDNDITAFSFLLNHEYGSLEHECVRYIISRLNYSIQSHQTQRKIVLSTVLSLHAVKQEKKNVSSLFQSHQCVAFSNFIWSSVVTRLTWVIPSPPLPISDTSLILLNTNVERSQNPKADSFDYVSAVILMIYSDFGFDFEKYFQSHVNTWLKYLIFFKEFDVAIRVIDSYFLRHIDNETIFSGCVDLSDYLNNILYSKNIGNLLIKTIVTTSVVCKSEKYLLFWMDQIIKIPNFSSMERAIQCMNEIAKSAIALGIYQKIPGRLFQVKELAEFGVVKRSFVKKIFGGYFDTSTISFREKIIKDSENTYFALLLFTGYYIHNRQKREKFTSLSKSIHELGHQFIIYRVLTYCLASRKEKIVDKCSDEFCEFFMWFFVLYFERKGMNFFGMKFIRSLSNSSEVMKNITEKLYILHNQSSNNVLKQIYLGMCTWIKLDVERLSGGLSQSSEFSSSFPIGFDQGAVQLNQILQFGTGEEMENFQLFTYLSAEWDTISQKMYERNLLAIKTIYPIYLEEFNLKNEKAKQIVKASPKTNIIKDYEKIERKYQKPVPPIHYNMTKGQKDLINSMGAKLTMKHFLRYDQVQVNALSEKKKFIMKYMETTQKLYLNKLKKIVLEIPCKPLGLCKAPSKVEFYYEELEEQVKMKEMLKKLKKSSKKFESNLFLSRSYDDISENLCHQILSYSVTVERVISNNLHVEGCTLFYFLATVRVAPSLDKIFYPYQKRLADQFISNHPDELVKLFTYILETGKCLEFASMAKVQSSMYIKFFEILFLNLNKLDSDLKIRVVSKFDVEWFVSQGTSSERKEMMKLLFVIILNGSKDKLNMWFVQFYLKILNNITNFGECFTLSIDSILNNLKEIPIFFLTSYVSNLLVFLHPKIREEKLLNDKQTFENLVDLINNKLWGIRIRSKFSLYENVNYEVNHLLKNLLTAVLKSVKVEDPSQPKMDQLFVLNCRVFDSYIFVIDEIPPCELSNSTHAKLYSEFFDAFLEVFSYLKSFSAVPNLSLSQNLWFLYYKQLYYTHDGSFLNVINAKLSQLQWEIPTEQIENYVFDFHILCDSYGTTLKASKSAITLVHQMFKSINFQSVSTHQFSTHFCESAVIVFSFLYEKFGDEMNCKDFLLGPWDSLKLNAIQSIISKQMKTTENRQLIWLLARVLKKSVGSDVGKFTVVYKYLNSEIKDLKKKQKRKSILFMNRTEIIEDQYRSIVSFEKGASTSSSIADMVEMFKIVVQVDPKVEILRELKENKFEFNSQKLKNALVISALRLQPQNLFVVNLMVREFQDMEMVSTLFHTYIDKRNLELSSSFIRDCESKNFILILYLFYRLPKFMNIENLKKTIKKLKPFSDELFPLFCLFFSVKEQKEDVLLEVLHHIESKIGNRFRISGIFGKKISVSFEVFLKCVLFFFRKKYFVLQSERKSEISDSKKYEKIHFQAIEFTQNYRVDLSNVEFLKKLVDILELDQRFL